MICVFYIILLFYDDGVLRFQLWTLKCLLTVSRMFPVALFEVNIKNLQLINELLFQLLRPIKFNEKMEAVNYFVC